MADAEVPTKRPRGRPRKDGLPAGSVARKKRRRGRPRKRGPVPAFAFAGNKRAADAPKQSDEFLRGFTAGWLAASEAMMRTLTQT